MSCGCAPSHFKKLLAPIGEGKRKEIRKKVKGFLNHLKSAKEAKGTKDISHVTEGDVIFFNGTIYTMEAENATEEAVVVADDKIIFIGSFYQASFFRGEKTQMVDLKGRTLMPGFIDSHFHIEM